MTDRPSWNFPFVLVASPEDLQDGAFLIVELYRETAALPISYDPNADDYEGRQQEPSSRHTMIATASVPLITLFRNKVDGQMIALDDVALTFASLYAKHPATRDHTLRLSLEVPEFWGLVDPAHDVFQTMREPHPSSSIPRQSAQPMLSMAEARLPPVRDNFGSAANPSSRYLTPPRDGLTSADWNSKPRRFSPQPYAQPSHQQRPLDDSYNQPQVDYSQPQDQSPFGAQQDLFPISNENVKSSSLLRKDIEQRQVLIDRLTRELDRRTEAVKRVGQELLNLRDLNARLENKNQTLHRRLEDADIKTARLMSTADIDVLSLDEIRRRYVLLVYKLDKAMKTNTGLVKEIEGLQDVDFEKTALEDRFLELRQAHTAQQSILQKMQAKLDKFAKSRQTIERQEQVISKLEGIFQEMTRKEVLEPHNPIEHFIRAVCREGAIYDHALAKIVTEENSKLTSQLAELNVQVAGLQSENDNLKEELAKNAWEGEDARRRFEEAAAQRYEEYNWKARYQTAVTRAERAEGKIQALEDELAQNAQSFAQQMSQLRRYAAETTTALNNVKAVNAQYREQYSPSPILTPEPTPAPVNEDQRPGVGKAKAAPVAQNAPGRKKK
ncbi:hypothetical protein DFS34DRAFT_351581 [Phlyctochytrium arcticum]|nr:hypothetical protein DFS34DRAFT_351581 [Phlyctochytrium arcticum]